MLQNAGRVLFSGPAHRARAEALEARLAGSRERRAALCITCNASRESDAAELLPCVSVEGLVSARLRRKPFMYLGTCSLARHIICINLGLYY